VVLFDSLAGKEHFDGILQIKSLYQETGGKVFS